MESEEYDFRMSHKKTIGFIHKESNAILIEYYKDKNVKPPYITHKMVYAILKTIKESPELITGKIKTG